MKLILEDTVARFRNLFVDKKEVPCDRLPTQKISPSGLDCEVAAAFKLQGIVPEKEFKSFNDGCYSAAGSARHAAIQEFLANHKEVEWVNIEEYIKENDLPFTVDYEYGIEKKAEEYGLTCDQICKLVGSYERLLRHTNGWTQFKLDGLIKWEGKYYILEIKTCSEADLNQAPLIKHQPQAWSYAFMLKIDTIIWIYEDRTKFKKVIAFQQITDYEMAQIKNKLNKIITNRMDVTKLDRSKNCKYCLYKTHCFQIFKSNSTIF